MPPHVGLVIIDGKVFRHYIHTPSPGESYEYTWSVKEGDLKGWEEIEEELYPLYLIEDEHHKRLGALIPEMVVPYWGMMAQTTAGPEPIFEFVAAVKADLQKAKELHDRIRAVSESIK